jgi:hypothetical protein
MLAEALDGACARPLFFARREAEHAQARFRCAVAGVRATRAFPARISADIIFPFVVRSSFSRHPPSSSRDVMNTEPKESGDEQIGLTR